MMNENYMHVHLFLQLLGEIGYGEQYQSFQQLLSQDCNMNPHLDISQGYNSFRSYFVVGKYVETKLWISIK